MEYLPGGLTLEFIPEAFPLSTDSMVLAHFARLPKNARVLDLGSGCGTLGHLLCARDPGCSVTGIELDPQVHQCALDNIQRNSLGGRMNSLCWDLRQLPREIYGAFDCCISNPPYFSGGPASRTHANARREDQCSCGDLFCAAGKALKFGGDFFLVHRPERLAELITAAGACRLEAKHLRLLRHKQEGPIALILLQFRKGAKPGLMIDECYLFGADGSPSDTYREIYHLQEG